MALMTSRVSRLHGISHRRSIHFWNYIKVIFGLSQSLPLIALYLERGVHRLGHGGLGPCHQLRLARAWLFRAWVWPCACMLLVQARAPLLHESERSCLLLSSQCFQNWVSHIHIEAMIVVVNMHDKRSLVSGNMYISEILHLIRL